MKRRKLLTFILALMFSLGVWTIASAHAELVSSEPAAGARLTAAPTKVTLVFSEEIAESASDSNFTVTAAGGKTVGTGKLDTNDLDHKTLSGTLDAGLADGVYTVSWNALTPDDKGHSEGSFTFGVNVDPGAQPTAEEHDEATATAAPASTTAPAATTRPAATAAPAATSAPASGAPGALPKTGESAPSVGLYFLAAAVILVSAGLALVRFQRRV
jgi:LPXTG-motif cell wall-anchored protein